MPMVTKLFRVVTCGDELSPINAHDISMEWSCWVKWQIKYISPPAEDVLGRCWHSFRGSQTWPFDQVTKMRSCDCLKNLFSWGLLLMNLEGCWLYGGYSSCKCLSRHRLLVLKFLGEAGLLSYSKKNRN